MNYIKTFILSLLLTFTVFGKTFADTVTYTATIPANFNFTTNTIGYVNASANVSLPQWNPDNFSGYNLQSVTYSLQGYYFFNYSLTTGPNAFADVNIEYSDMNVSLNGPFNNSPNITLNENDFGGVRLFELTNIAPGSSIAGNSGLIISRLVETYDLNDNITNYIGTSTVQFLINERSLTSIRATALGMSELYFSITAGKYNAVDVQITYEYTTIPESSTVMGAIFIIAVITSKLSYDKFKKINN